MSFGIGPYGNSPWGGFSLTSGSSILVPISPTANATGTSRVNPVSFRIETNPNSGWDYLSLVVDLGGVRVVQGGSFEPPYYGTVVPDGGHLTVTLGHPLFDGGVQVTVAVEVRDLSGSLSSFGYSFYTGDASVSPSEVLTLVESLGMGLSVSLPETLTMVESMSPLVANASDNVNLSELLTLGTAYTVDMSETLGIYEFGQMGMFKVTPVTPTTLSVEFPEEMQLEGIQDPIRFGIQTSTGIALTIAKAEAITQTLQTGAGGSSIGTGFSSVSLDTLTGNFNPAHAGSYLHIGDESFRILTGSGSVVVVDRPLRQGLFQGWVHTSAVKSVVLTTTEATQGRPYSLTVTNARRRRDGSYFTDSAPFTGLGEKPRVTSVDFIAETSNVRIRFSEGMRIDSELLDPGEYSFVGPSEVDILRVVTEDSRTVLLQTSGFLPGASYTLVVNSSGTPKDVAGNPIDPDFNTAAFTTSVLTLSKSIFTDKGPIAKPPLVLYSGVGATIQTSATAWFGNVTLSEITLPVTLPSTVEGKVLRVLGTRNGGDFPILTVVGSRLRVEGVFHLPDAQNGSLSWEIVDLRVGEVADDPSDVTVRVNGTPVVPDAVVGLLGQVVLPTAPGPSDVVSIDYAYVPEPTVEIRRLNSKEFHLNGWLRDGKGLTSSQHTYRFRNVLPKVSRYNPETLSATLPEPKLRDLHYRAFERAYSATLNDAGTLKLNNPLKRVSYPPMQRQVGPTSVAYSGNLNPEQDGWVRRGSGSYSTSGGSLSFSDSGAHPIFWVRPVELTFEHTFAATWRMSVNSTIPQGVFTGVACGWSGPLYTNILGFLTVAGVKKVGFLRANSDPSLPESWYGGLDGNGLPTGTPVDLDWSVVRSYRLLRSTSGAIRFFVDGSTVPLLLGVEAHSPKLEELVSSFDFVQGAFFGSISRSASNSGALDFFRYQVTPSNPQDTAPFVDVSYEGTDDPELGLSPWTPIGGYGFGAPRSDSWVLDSYNGLVDPQLGKVDGGYRGYVRLEPLLSSASEWDVDFDASTRTATFGIHQDALTLAVDDGQLLTQVSFLSTESQPKYSYVGDAIPTSPWLSLGAASASVLGRSLRISDSTLVDGRVFAREDQEPLAGPLRVFAPALDFFVEASFEVISYVPDSSPTKFCGATFDVYDGSRSIGVLLRESATGVRQVALHSDGVLVESFDFDWLGSRHTIRVRKNLVGNLVTLFADSQLLGSVPYTDFSVGSGNATASFGSATAISASSLSVVDWFYLNVWRAPDAPKRYVGVWRGLHTGTLADYHLPVKVSGVVAASGNTLTGNYDFPLLGVSPGDLLVIDTGANAGVYESVGVSSGTITVSGILASEGDVRFRVVRETDWSIPATYRVVKDGLGNLSLSREGQVEVKLSYGPLDLPPSDQGIFEGITTGVPSVSWGSFLSGELSQSAWNFVRYSLQSSSGTRSRIVPHHERLNRRNVISSPEHLSGTVAHMHTQTSSSSTGVPHPWHEYAENPLVTAYTRLNDSTPLVPQTQNYKTRRPQPRVTFLHGLNSPSNVLNSLRMTLNDGNSSVEVVVPDDVLYHSLEVVEKTSGVDDVLTVVSDDSGLVSLGSLNYTKDVCVNYAANTLPEVDPSFGTPWVLESTLPGSVTATVFSGILTYDVGGTPTNTIYRNATPLTDPVSLNSTVDFRLRVLEDSTSGEGDTGIRFGFSALGLTAALAFIAAPNGLREVVLLDLEANVPLASLPVDYLDGVYHTYRLIKNSEMGTLELLVDP